ncbi:MAG: GtrA family protein [Beijerinckiaceae bacterium]
MPGDAASIGRLVRFTAVGLAAMAAYAIIVTLLTFLGLRPAWLASGVAYAIAAIWSYVGHRNVSFRSDAPHRVAGPRFVLATAAGQTIAIAIPAGLTDAAGLAQLWSTAAVCIVCPAVSFILNSRFVFADGRASTDIR